MDIKFFLQRLSENKQVLQGLINGISEEQARWKPASDRWSILEVINHLYDEEKDDFRARLELLLFHPTERWLPIDPPKWAIEHEYNKKELNSSWENFLIERNKSLLWLEALVSPQWQAGYEHPAGMISAGDLLASWLAHDLLHIKQITKLHWDYLSFIALPYRTAYAGTW